MELSFVKLSPTQNTTVLVDTPVPRGLQPEAARILLGHEGVGGEQAGFLEPATLPGARCRLQMMGGEFCGNATMSLAALWAQTDGIQPGEERDYELEISGSQTLVGCHIRRTNEGFRGRVAMPLPREVAQRTIQTDSGLESVQAVVFEGITHLLLPAGRVKEAEIRRRIGAWCREMEADALGVLRFDAQQGAMTPIVHVRCTDTTVNERGCGSGTAALAYVRALEAGGGWQGEVRQPGGIMRGEAVWRDGAIAEVFIEGSVRVVARGVCWVNLGKE